MTDVTKPFYISATVVEWKEYDISHSEYLYLVKYDRELGHMVSRKKRSTSSGREFNFWKTPGVENYTIACGGKFYPAFHARPVVKGLTLSEAEEIIFNDIASV